MQRGLGGSPHERLHQDIVFQTFSGEPIKISLTFLGLRPGFSGVLFSFELGGMFLVMNRDSCKWFILLIYL
ncbi:MAG: hypothetical protein F6K64_25650 [Moorea sp. SIO3A2]|nr:hypothetical protein [Moorena sp. SIO3A2]